MKKINIIFSASFILLLSSCGIYNKYQSSTKVSDTAFGVDSLIQASTVEQSIASISWREFFTDEKLKALIDTALVRNSDITIAQLKVQQAEAALKASKLAWLPSLNFAPTADFTRFNNSSTKEYNLSLNANWDLGSFGSLTNARRNAEAVKLQAEDLADYTRAKVVSSVAQAYLHLQMLDRRLEILKHTCELWQKSLDTQRALMENGKAYSTAVNQMEASLIKVRLQIFDVKDDISQVETTLCKLLSAEPTSFPRTAWTNYDLPETIQLGIPAEILQRRADVRAAERKIEVAYYGVNEAKAAFFPNLTLSGALGWTNKGLEISSPTKLLVNALLSLTQPIFAKGKLKQRLEISKIEQRQAMEEFTQTIITAGQEVNNRLWDCQTAKNKDVLYKRQVEVLREAFIGTHELMNNGKASYLEVLTAQEALLEAELNECTNLYEGYDNLIKLYEALGGGEF